MCALKNHGCIMCNDSACDLKVRIRCHLWHWLNLCKWNMQAPNIFISIIREEVDTEYWAFVIDSACESSGSACAQPFVCSFFRGQGLYQIHETCWRDAIWNYRWCSRNQGWSTKWKTKSPEQGLLLISSCHFKLFGNCPIFCFHECIYNWKKVIPFPPWPSDL